MIAAVASTKPASVPTNALTTVAPVVTTFDRRMLSVASTTQKAWLISLAFATSTDSASASPARRQLRNHTDRGARCGASRLAALRSAPSAAVGSTSAKSSSMWTELPVITMASTAIDNVM